MTNSTMTLLREDPLTRRQAGKPLAVSRWLLWVAGLVLLMVIVGGITRLTESGLSITEWKPIMGALPPLSAADWAEHQRLLGWPRVELGQESASRGRQDKPALSDADVR